jgi:TetR/AcrR family transcriptional regulator
MAHPRHLPAEQRRNGTVQALIALAAEQNPTDITTAAVAKRMGLTQGALFRHFPSKDAILEAVMEWVAERLLARIDKAAQTASSPLTAVEAIFLTHIEFVIEHPGVPRMLIGELQRSVDTVAKGMVRTLLRCYTERLIRLMEEGKKQGQLDAGLDSAAAATLFVGTIQGLVMQSLLTGNVSHIRRQAPGAFAIYRRGIASGKLSKQESGVCHDHRHPVARKKWSDR